MIAWARAEVSADVPRCTPGVGIEAICVWSASSCFFFALTELFDDQTAVESPAIVTTPSTAQAIRSPACGGVRAAVATPPR